MARYSLPSHPISRRRNNKISSNTVVTSFALVVGGSILVILWVCLASQTIFPEATKSDARNLNLEPSLRSGPQASSVCSKDEIFCRYEGNCPDQTTCVMKPACSGGVCEAYHSTKATTASLPDKDECVEKCLAEIKWDERSYYHATVDVLSQTKALPASSRPAACVIQYRRNHNALPEDDESFRAEWLSATQHHYVSRVDPVPNTNGTMWQAMCYNPCKVDSDCAPSAQSDVSPKKAFVCMNGSCQQDQNPETSYWMKEKDKDKEVVIVSGANSRYFGGLQNLAASARYWAPKSPMVVYNLGMTEPQLEEISKWSNVVSVRWKDGIPKEYPKHVHVPKKYAWKPIAINESLADYGMMFWLDAGSTLTGPIDNAVRILKQTGLFLVKGQDADMKPKANEGTYKYFGLDKGTFLDGPHFSGNTQAFLSPSRYVDTIVTPNAKCALTPECIDPPGASLSNHRYDQTTLSLLAYGVQAPHHTEYLAASKGQLNADLDKPSSMFVWTARTGCKHYFKKGY